MVEYVKREDVPECYQEMLKTESHHSHLIVDDEHGTLRWEENLHVNELMKSISLNDLIPLLTIIGHDKNSEVYRSLYRNMGYSLSGYTDVFYWECNNEDMDEYRPPNR